MKLGLLWYDADQRVSPQARLAEAATRFAEKFGRPANCCHVNPDDLFADQAISVVADPSILKHHFWVGRDETLEPERPRRGRKAAAPSSPPEAPAAVEIAAPPPGDQLPVEATATPEEPVLLSADAPVTITVEATPPPMVRRRRAAPVPEAAAATTPPPKQRMARLPAGAEPAASPPASAPVRTRASKKVATQPTPTPEEPSPTPTRSRVSSASAASESPPPKSAKRQPAANAAPATPAPDPAPAEPAPRRVRSRPAPASVLPVAATPIQSDKGLRASRKIRSVAATPTAPGVQSAPSAQAGKRSAPPPVAEPDPAASSPAPRARRSKDARSGVAEPTAPVGRRGRSSASAAGSAARATAPATKWRGGSAKSAKDQPAEVVSAPSTNTGTRRRAEQAPSGPTRPPKQTASTARTKHASPNPKAGRTPRPAQACEPKPEVGPSPRKRATSETWRTSSDKTASRETPIGGKSGTSGQPVSVSRSKRGGISEASGSRRASTLRAGRPSVS